MRDGLLLRRHQQTHLWELSPARPSNAQNSTAQRPHVRGLQGRIEGMDAYSADFL